VAGRLSVEYLYETIIAAFPSQRRSDQLLNILSDHLARFTDQVVRDAAKRLVATATRAPAVADIIQACRSIAGPGAAEPAPHYVEYWGRPPAERQAIDAARAEFHRVTTDLINGASVYDLYPPESEPCQLADRMRELRGEPKPETPKPRRPVLPLLEDVAHVFERNDW